MEPETQVATPNHQSYSNPAPLPTVASSSTIGTPAPLMPRRTVSSSTPGSTSKLGEQPRDKLQAWLNRYMDEKMALLEQRLAGGEEEDPEMVDMKM